LLRFTVSSPATQKGDVSVPRPRIYRTNAEKQAAYRQRKRKRQPVYFRHKSDVWETPPALFDALDQEFHFTTDLAALPDNAKCPRFYTPGQDSLQQRWEGVCWMNPPYGKTTGLWVAKAYESARAGATIVSLLLVRTDTKWWQRYCLPPTEVRFVPGRLTFGGASNPAPFPNAVVIFRPPRFLPGGCLLELAEEVKASKLCSISSVPT
jgi:phage N-6-adenine-methyltransferase